jgi:putative ABC transport system substrate-binding protein
VFAQVPDPVALGMVASLARPGGNITGFALYDQAIAAKWVELLKQIAPSVFAWRSSAIRALRPRPV